MSTEHKPVSDFEIAEFYRLKLLEREVAQMRRLQRQYVTQRGQVLFANKLKSEQLVDTRLAQLRTSRSLTQHESESEA